MSSDFDRPDCTPEQALRFYANQKNFDIVDGHARILDNGAIASNALKHHSIAHLEMKGDVELFELCAEVSRLTAELKQCQNNHKNVVDRLRLATQRPDLPVDRLPAMERMRQLQEELDVLRSPPAGVVTGDMQVVLVRDLLRQWKEGDIGTFDVVQKLFTITGSAPSRGGVI